MRHYETVSEAVNDLVKRGYTENFLKEQDTDCPVYDAPSICLPPQFYAIDEVYRFDGMTDPADEMIIFAISSKKLLAKGIVVNGYGVYSDNNTSKIVQELKMNPNLFI